MAKNSKLPHPDVSVDNALGACEGSAHLHTDKKHGFNSLLNPLYNSEQKEILLNTLKDLDKNGFLSSVNNEANALRDIEEIAAKFMFAKSVTVHKSDKTLTRLHNIAVELATAATNFYQATRLNTSIDDDTSGGVNELRDSVMYISRDELSLHDDRSLVEALSKRDSPFILALALGVLRWRIRAILPLLDFVQRYKRSGNKQIKFAQLGLIIDLIDFVESRLGFKVSAGYSLSRDYSNRDFYKFVKAASDPIDVVLKDSSLAGYHCRIKYALTIRKRLRNS